MRILFASMRSTRTSCHSPVSLVISGSEDTTSASTRAPATRINTRLAYRGLGLDLKTERPKPRQIAAGVQRVLGDDPIKAKIARVAAALKASRPLETMEAAIASRTPVCS
jgi:hypothetical protein